MQGRQQSPVSHMWPSAGGQPFDSAQGRPFERVAARRVSKAQPEGIGVSIEVENLTRTFEPGGEKVHALRQVNLKIPAGSLTVIKGPSGSGKTTLLNLIAGLDEPTAGIVRFGERSLAEMSPQEKIDLCRPQIGFVFQTFGLLPLLSVEENVRVPLQFLRTPC